LLIREPMSKHDDSFHQNRYYHIGSNARIN